MGQRYVQLNSTYTGNAGGTAVLHVSQIPPNPAILAPGPALFFVNVNGVPSIGVQVMIGSGKLGVQEILPVAELPASSITNPPPQSDQSSNSGTRVLQHWTLSSMWTIVFSVILSWTVI